MIEAELWEFFGSFQLLRGGEKAGWSGAWECLCVPAIALNLRPLWAENGRSRLENLAPFPRRWRAGSRLLSLDLKLDDEVR